MQVRLSNLTGLRAYAAVWVIVFHAGSSWNRGGWLIRHGYLGVDVFFVLSGFVMSLAYARTLPPACSATWYRNFVVRRLAKVYPIHLITFLLSAAALLLASHVHYAFQASTENTPWTALCTVLLIHAFGVTRELSWNPPSWSISAEWFAYTVLFSIFAFGLRRVRARTVAALAAGSWVLFVCFCHTVLHRSIGLNTAGILRIAPEFFSGYLLFRMLPHTAKRHGDLCVLCGLALVLLICCSSEPFVFLLVPAILLLLHGLYAGGRVTDALFGNRLAVLLGDASFSIYMFQESAFVLVNQCFRRLHLFGTPGLFAVYALAALLLSSAVGRAAYLLIEEPARRLILKRNRAEPNLSEAVQVPGAEPTAPPQSLAPAA